MKLDTKRPQTRIVSDLPAKWRTPRGCVAQGSVKINGGPLRIKVLVFKDRKSLRAHWRRAFGAKLTGHVNGVVTRLQKCWVKKDRNGVVYAERIGVDRRFVAVMGLIVSELEVEVISHEAVHAAMAFLERKSKSWWDTYGERCVEEVLAYPIGAITREVTRFLIKRGFVVTG